MSDMVTASYPVDHLAELDTACPDCECCGIDECDDGDCAGQFCPCTED